MLENHHASTSWQLLKSSEKYNFLCNLDAAEWKRLRYLIVENILATDLSKHFEILQDFNSRVGFFSFFIHFFVLKFVVKVVTDINIMFFSDEYRFIFT